MSNNYCEIVKISSSLRHDTTIVHILHVLSIRFFLLFYYCDSFVLIIFCYNKAGNKLFVPLSHCRKIYDMISFTSMSKTTRAKSVHLWKCVATFTTRLRSLWTKLTWQCSLTVQVHVAKLAFFNYSLQDILFDFVVFAWI